MAVPPRRGRTKTRGRTKLTDRVRREEVNHMTKTYLRYAKYALTSLSTVGFAFSGT